MASDSMDEAMKIRSWKSLKLLFSHAERKQKAQFIEDPKHIHGGKQGVGRGWFNLSLDQGWGWGVDVKGKGDKEWSWVLFLWSFPPVHPLVLFHPILCNTLKNISNHPEGSHTGLGRGTILLYTVDKQPWNHKLYRET